MTGLVTTDYKPTPQTMSYVACLAEGQSNLGFCIDDEKDPNNVQIGYIWQNAQSDMLTLLGYTGQNTRVAALPGYLKNGGYTVVGGTSTYDTDAAYITTQNLLTPIASGSSFTDPSTWNMGTRGLACVQAATGTIGNLASDALMVFCRMHDESDSKGSKTKMSFYPKALPRLFDIMFRATQTLPVSRQPIFMGTSSFASGIVYPANDIIRATQLGLVNSGKNIHFWIGNCFDSVDRFVPNDYSHMDHTSDYNAMSRGMFQQCRVLWQQGFSKTNLNWMIGLGARTNGWTVPRPNTVYWSIAPDRNDDIIPPSNPNFSVYQFTEPSGTSYAVTGIKYLNSTTLEFTLNGTPSASAMFDYCRIGGFWGIGSLPTCNFHTKVASMPAYAQTIMAARLKVGVPIQRLDEPLQRDKTANINADNVQLGTLSTGSPPSIRNAISINTIGNQTLGNDLTIGGPFTGAPPTGFTYTVN